MLEPSEHGTVGVDVIETGVSGSPSSGLLKPIFPLGMGVSISPDLDRGFDAREACVPEAETRGANARRGLAFNSREICSATRASMDYFKEGSPHTGCSKC